MLNLLQKQRSPARSAWPVNTVVQALFLAGVAVAITALAPNPASTSAALSFAVKEQSETRITLYNTLGQQVATVYEGTPQAGEEQRAQVDVSGLSSGTYFLRLQANGKTRTQRLTVVR